VVQLAEVSRARRALTAAAERRAAEAERGREEEALRRAQEERLRIARELHDVTSHTVSVIALHAAVAVEAIERAGGPEQARTALRTIRSASRQAMADMAAALGVLRADASPLRPMPDRRRLCDLVETTARAGLQVELVEKGADRPLPPALDLTVYRVVQEALTNTLRHAGATTAMVTLRFEVGAVVVQVDDDGRADPGAQRSTSDSGYGLIGMAERVAAVGGQLSAGHTATGGWQVVAWLPTEATA
jgi:signal transduction histidine kinase